MKGLLWKWRCNHFSSQWRLLESFRILERSKMKTISREEYHRLFDGNTKILEKDKFGKKVVETSDKKIIKIFRLKSYFSSAFLNPYAVRFKKNAECLKHLGIPTVTVDKIAYCPEEKRYIIIYQKLEGSTLRQVFEHSYDPGLLLKLAKFIANLHRNGVYFRSLHLGNILLMEKDKLGLIDIADMRVLRKSLSPRLRVRNFRHLVRYADDVSIIKQLGLSCFLVHYLKTANQSSKWEIKFHRYWKSMKLPM